MRYFSAFSGCGGFELGIERAYADNRLGGATADGQADATGHLSDPESRDEERRQRATCVGMSEIDKYASAVLRYRFPDIPNYGDISKIDWATVPDFDLLVGGSPCQSFSVAGKRAGFDGASGLFWEYLRTLQEKKPEHFIWENVKGVLSSNEGRDFAEILNAFSEAGYSLSWQILNAKSFGVPQNRERVFVIGTRNGSAREILFEAGATGTHPETCLDASCRAETHAIATRHLNRNGGLKTHHSTAVQAAETPHVLSDAHIRRLTPIECERLMSWPDDWTRWGVFDNLEKTEISDSQRYKMAGNGVVSKVVAEVVKAHLL